MLLRGPNPIYNYFWVAIAEDGVTVIPEFDFETGAENRWFDVKDRKMSKVMWYPFTEAFADRVSANTPRNCVEGVGDALELEVPEGCLPAVSRLHAISQYYFYECIYCGTKIYWMPEGHEEPEGIPGMVVVYQSESLHCPSCGATNEWYCDKCKHVIADPILSNSDDRLRFRFNLGEARCPTCEPDNPNGLLRIQHLVYKTGLSHSIEYMLGYTEVEAKILPGSALRPVKGFADGKLTVHRNVWTDQGEPTKYT